MYTLKKRIRRVLITVYHTLSLDKFRMFIGGFDRQIEIAIQKFGSNSDLSPRELKSDIKKCYYRYLTTPDEYFLYGFEGTNEKYRSSFLPDNKKVRYLLKTISEEKYVNDLCDKFNFYNITSKYFKRKVIQVGGTQTSSLNEFIDYAKSRKSAFVKPISSSWGNGAHIIVFPPNIVELEQIYVKYCKMGGVDF